MFDLQGFGALLLSGATVTIKLAMTSLVIGMFFGLLGATAKMSNVWLLRKLATVYTATMRGIPELLLVLFIYYGGSISSFDPSNSNDIDSHSIAAQRSTVSSQWLEKAYPKADMKLYDTLSNAFLDLGSGRVDAMVSDKLPAIEWLSSSSGSNYVLKGDEIDIDDNFAIAVRPGDELQAKINKSLANLKANGTYDKINQKYFAVPVAATPTTDTAAP